MLVSFDLLAVVITLMSAPGASEKITAAAQISLALRQVVQEVEFRSALVASDNEIPQPWNKHKQGEASSGVVYPSCEIKRVRRRACLFERRQRSHSITASWRSFAESILVLFTWKSKAVLYGGLIDSV